ncbi:MAG TPA: hypothetical protein DDY78_27475 [Planctomycetales bacterium]|nr:hypothetical protein [Planctomycetales bacterium]
MTRGGWMLDQADLLLRQGDAQLELPDLEFPRPPPPGGVQCACPTKCATGSATFFGNGPTHSTGWRSGRRVKPSIMRTGPAMPKLAVFSPDIWMFAVFVFTSRTRC